MPVPAWRRMRRPGRAKEKIGDMKQMWTDRTYEYADNLYVNMTNQCPNQCVFCLRENSRGSIYGENLWYQGPEPSREELFNSLCGRDLFSYQEIVFCGYGEPTCRWDDVLWLCDRLLEMGSFSLRLNTNGLGDLINHREIGGELHRRFNTVSVSLNASTPERYQQLCRSRYGRDALPAVIRFTARAVMEVPFVRMTVVGDMPKWEMEACRRICDRIGADFYVRDRIEV